MKDFSSMETSRDIDYERKESPYMETSHDNYEKKAYKNNSFQLLNQSLSFTGKNVSLLSATSVLSPLLRAYNTNASLYNLTCTD